MTTSKGKYRSSRLKDSWPGLFFVAGIFITIPGISIYGVTFIPLYIPLLIWPLAGIAATLLINGIFDIRYPDPYTSGGMSMVVTFLHHAAFFGGVFFFLFMWVNRHFTDHIKRTDTVNILRYGHYTKSSRSCGRPYILIHYEDLEKRLVFLCGTAVEKYDSVHVEIEKGAFGFDVITKKVLTGSRETN